MIINGLDHLYDEGCGILGAGGWVNRPKSATFPTDWTGEPSSQSHWNSFVHGRIVRLRGLIACKVLEIILGRVRWGSEVCGIPPIRKGREWMGNPARHSPGARESKFSFSEQTLTEIDGPVPMESTHW